MKLRTLVLVSHSFLALSVNAAKYYVDASRPDDLGAGTTWATAKRTIQSAMNLATPGDTVLVTNGVYACISSGNKAITVQSVNGSAVTVIDGANANCCANLGSSSSHYATSLIGFTLRNGYASRGGGSCYGTISNCVITANRATDSGGGSYYGKLYNCKILNNKAEGSSGYGGGAYVSTLYDCLITGNQSGYTGGGVAASHYSSAIYNCTVVNNTADFGGGVSGMTVKNCIVWGNSVTYNSNENNYSGGDISHSCTTPLPTGVNNIAQPPLFANPTGGDYRLLWDSPCANVGNNSYVSPVGTDLAGNPRIQNGTVDMGAYEGGVTTLEPVTFSPNSGTVRTNSVTVTMNCPTTGSVIHYTTNGSEPTTNSLPYISPITLTSSATLTAKPFRAGMTGVATSAQYTVIQTVATPTFSPLSGAAATNFLEVALACATDGATVRYTTDGSSPTAESAEYTNLVKLTRSATVKAKAFNSGMADSATATATYTVYVAVPDFDPPTGTVATNSVLFSLSCATDGADIRYTTNGTVPTAASTLYTNPVALYQSGTIKAIAYKTGLTTSSVGAASYTVIPTVTTPAFSPASGTTAASSIIVSITCSTAGATIRYTLDGTDPTPVSTSYTAAINLTQSTLVKAKAFKSGMADSAVISASYAVLQPVATPVFSHTNGTTFVNSLEVTLSCATPEATLRYTTDGIDPTEESTAYLAPLTIDRNTTIKVRAYKTGMAASDIASASYRSLVLYVDAAQTDNSGDGSCWATAKQTIQSAVDGAVDGDTVLVTNGVYTTGGAITPGYSASNRVSITKDIVVQSVNGLEVTVIEGSGTNFFNTASSVRCVFMSKGKIEGFTLQNGATRDGSSLTYDNSGGGVCIVSNAVSAEINRCIIKSCKASYGGGSHYGTLNNCILANNSASQYGGGVFGGTLYTCTLTGNNVSSYGGGTYFGTLYNCTLTGNTAYSAGGGTCHGTLYNCTLTGNTTSHSGGGAYKGTLYNCTLTGNTAARNGGGAYYGTLYNCTLAKNVASYYGSGAYYGTLQNCIVWNNTGGASDRDNHYESTFVFSCTAPLPTGPGNIDSDPKFVDDVSGDLRLRHGSPCLDAGANEYASFATDLAGNPRIQNGKVEMGAFEGSVSGPFIDISVQGEGSVYPAHVQAVTNGASIAFTAQTSTRPFVGFYTNGVFASSDTDFTWAGISTNGELRAVFETRTWHVNSSRPDDFGDGLSWASAKKTIQAAVDSALAGDTVLVTNGTYNVGAVTTPNFSLKNRVVITKPITVRSVNGRSTTIITGSGSNAYGTASAIRCVYMTDGILDGFTLQNGATYSTLQSANFNDNSGGGVCAYGHAEIRNCLISSCKAFDGAGLYYGTLTNCTLNSNTATGQGGGACQSKLNACTLTGNAAASGGGAYYSTLYNSTLTRNTASSSGGGAYGCTLNNCALSANVASHGGGASDGTLRTCKITGNIANSSSGGASGCTMNNCAITGNTAESAGGAAGCTLYNCTLTRNTSGSGSGLKSCTMNNCIVWDNRTSKDIVDNYYGGSFSYSCTFPLPSGLGNTSLDPLFCDTTDYRLQLGSPCLNAGSNGYVFVMTDLNGAPRIQDGAVDMGAYEGVGRCAAPAFSPVTGRSYTNSVTVTLSCTTAGVSMRYTTDGSEPTLDSSAYAGGFALTNSTTVKAKAFKAGMLESETAVADYAVIPTMATPTFSLPSGSLGTNTLAVAIECSTEDATIRYTLDGTAPTVESTAYAGTLTLTQSSVIKAKAFKSGMADSAISTATYTVYAAAPGFDPPTGAAATNSIDFSLSCLTEGVTIRYTTNGTEPTSSSTLYTGTVTVHQNTTVKAKAFKAGMADSATAAAVYTVFQTVATPTFSPDTGTAATNSLTITLLCVTSGSAIRYTLDGSAPTSESALYTGPVNLSQSATVRAKAFKSGMADSDIAEANFEIIHSAATPAFTPVTGTSFSNSLDVTITCATQDAAIRYTLDGSEPTADSPQYAGAIALTKSATVQARAFKAGLVESATASASYHCTVLFVDAARPDDSGDGSNWQTAKRTIQAAITAASAGDTVMVTNGLYNTGATVTPGYSVSNRVVITNAITVRSVNGADSTIIEGAGLTAYGTAEAIRCVYMNAGILDGFTLRNGATFDAEQSSSPYNSGGGGACMAGAVTGTEVRNCVVRNCRAYSGGAAYQGALKSCTLDQNWASLHGGATYESLLEDCLVNGNLAASNGGGAYYGTLNRCKLTGNVSESGGGTYYGTANNCLYIGNSAATGGAVYFGTLNSCTITGNTAESGGGTYNGTYYNCIVWGNTTLTGTVNNNTFGTFRYSCMLPLRTGIGNIAADPLFVSIGDLSLRAGSPCLNKGNNAYVTESHDILGNARIQEGTVDMGAYEGSVPSVPLPEFIPASGTVFTNSLLIAITNAMPGAVIRYTLDGSEPNANSEAFTGALLLADTTTVRAKAFSPGYVESLIATATYTEIQKIDTPVFSPVSGTVGTNSISVTLTCATPDVTLRYTLDGSEPDDTSSLYGGPINLAQTGNLHAKAFKSGMTDSDAISASYTVIQTVAAPVISPASGTAFTNSLVVTITCATPDALIRYTLDGSTPTSGSALYTKQVKISRDLTVCARAFKDGLLDSPATEAVYSKVVTLPVAVDATNLVFSAGGTAVWEGRNTLSASDAVDAAQSGVIGDSQTSWMETALSGPGTVSFWWKTSCEDDPYDDNWDYVCLLVDGVEQRRQDGITDWVQVTFTLAEGPHTLRWEYRKDESLGDGDDCAWVDQLTFTQGPLTSTTTTPVPVPYAWLAQYQVLLSLSGGDYEAAALADVDGDGHLAWQEYVTGSIPTNRDSVFLSLITTSQGFPSVTWTPDMGGDRVYQVEGKTNLTDTAWSPTNAASRFFRVKVSLP